MPPSSVRLCADKMPHGRFAFFIHKKTRRTPPLNILELLLPKSQTAYLYEDCTLRQGLEKMRHHGYRVIPVIDRKGRYVGAVSEGDFLWHMIDRAEYGMEAQEKYRVRDLLPHAEENPPVRHDRPLRELLNCARQHNFVPVVDDRGCYIGIVKRRDIIGYFADALVFEKAPDPASRSTAAAEEPPAVPLLPTLPSSSPAAASDAAADNEKETQKRTG